MGIKEDKISRNHHTLHELLLLTQTHTHAPLSIEQAESWLKLSKKQWKLSAEEVVWLLHCCPLYTSRMHSSEQSSFPYNIISFIFIPSSIQQHWMNVKNLHTASSTCVGSDIFLICRFCTTQFYEWIFFFEILWNFCANHMCDFLRTRKMLSWMTEKKVEKEFLAHLFVIKWPVITIVEISF